MRIRHHSVCTRMQMTVFVGRRVSAAFSVCDLIMAGGSVRMAGPSGSAGRILP